MGHFSRAGITRVVRGLPSNVDMGKSVGAPEPALRLSKGLALFETWASTLPLWRAPLPVQTQRRRPLRSRNDSGLLPLCCQGPQEATGRGGSHHLLRFSSQVTTLLTFALSVLSFLQICLCRHSRREICFFLVRSTCHAVATAPANHAPPVRGFCRTVTEGGV